MSIQAVHLLLAFPLFAVVVGVDQRCLRQSLRMQFKGLLTPTDEQSSRQSSGSQQDDEERPATPLDYLEDFPHPVSPFWYGTGRVRQPD